MKYKPIVLATLICSLVTFGGVATARAEGDLHKVNHINSNGNDNSHIPHLTLRDANADPLEDMFNFSNPPSMNASIPAAPDASPTGPGCPFLPLATNG